MFNPRLLVVSLGNPAPYYDTLHSAGHWALGALLHQLPLQPELTTQRLGQRSTLVSRGPKHVLAQSPTLMNVSGPWVSKAWRQILDESSSPTLGLVLVHDDLELPLGAVKLKDWSRSHKGQNGVKSVNASLRWGDYKESSHKWARVSVGIGRPEGRDRETVSAYVLRPMGQLQKEVLGTQVGPKMLEALSAFEQEWAAEVEAAAKKS